MRSSTTLIIFIVSVMLAAIAVTVIYQTSSSYNSRGGETASGEGPEITAISVGDVAGRDARSIRIEIQGGEQPVNLNESVVVVQTPGGEQDLRVFY